MVYGLFTVGCDIIWEQFTTLEAATWVSRWTLSSTFCALVVVRRVQKVFCSMHCAKTTVPQTGFFSLMQILPSFPLPQYWLLFHLNFRFLSQFFVLCFRTSFSTVSLKNANIFPEYVIRFLSILNLGIPLGLGSYPVHGLYFFIQQFSSSVALRPLSTL